MLARTDHSVLRPLSAAQQHIDGLAFVDARQHLGKSFYIGHLGIGDLHHHVSLTNASLHSGVSHGVYPYTPFEIEFFFQGIGQIADGQP